MGKSLANKVLTIFSGDMCVDGKLGSQTCERKRVRCGEPLSPQTNPSTEWGLFECVSR